MSIHNHNIRVKDLMNSNPTTVQALATAFLAQAADAHCCMLGGAPDGELQEKFVAPGPEVMRDIAADLVKEFSCDLERALLDALKELPLTLEWKRHVIYTVQGTAGGIPVESIGDNGMNLIRLIRRNTGPAD